MLYTRLGAASCLEKLGFSPEDAAEVARVAKNYKLPKAATRSFAETLSKLNPFVPDKALSVLADSPNAQISMARAREVARKAKESTADLLKERPELRLPITMLRGSFNPNHSTRVQLSGFGRSSGPGNISIGPGGGSGAARKLFRAHGDKAKVNALRDFAPEQHRMLNNLIDAHEMDELLVNPKLTMGPYGHISPDVILREHNRLVTLPEGFQPVKDLHALTRAKETELLSPYVRFGEGERLSRHARKRITEDIEKVNIPKLLE